MSGKPLNLCFSHYGQGDYKSGAFSRLTVDRDIAAVSGDDLFANGESHAGSAIGGTPAVEPLKRLKDLLTIAFVEANAIVLYEYPAETIGNIPINLNNGRFRFLSVLYRIPNDVLKSWRNSVGSASTVGSSPISTAPFALEITYSRSLTASLATSVRDTNL